MTRAIWETVIEVLIQKSFWLFLIHNLNTAWPTKISMSCFSSLDNLLQDAYIIFSPKNVLIIFNEIEHKTF